MVAVERAADLLPGREQQVIFDVEQPGGVVAALDRRAQLHEPGALGAEHAGERALEAADLGLEAVDQVEALLHAARPGAVADDQPGAVDRFPDLDGERGARGPGIVARGGEAGTDRAGIVLGQRQVAADRWRG